MVAMALREKRSSVSWDVLEPGAVGDSRTLAGLLRRKRRAGEDPGSVPLRTLGTQGVTRTPRLRRGRGLRKEYKRAASFVCFVQILKKVHVCEGSNRHNERDS